MSSILELPSEIYHHIFSYLDYVKDICRDPYLSYLPVQKDEIDHLLRTPCFVDFEKELKALSELQPLSMTCSTFCKMIASYKPLSLIIRFSCHNLENCIRQRPVKRGFECETSYTMKLYVSRWYDFSIVEPTKQEFRILNISKWRNYLEKFINRRKACFRNIEYVGVFSDVGKNYCSSISIQPIQFPFSLFPKLKYMTLHLVGACIYAREIVPDHVIMNYVTSSTTFGNPPQVPLNPTDFGAFEYSQRNKSIHETIFSVVNKFPKQYLRVELYILILLKISKFEAARSLIDNFTIDEDYFSYAWNFSLAESFQNHDKDRFRATISLLARIKQKFKGIVIKRLCINSMEQLKIVEEYGVLDQRDIMPNITLHFLTYISNNQETELLKSLIDKYGVYIGRYGCSLLYTLSDFMINFVKTNVKGYDFIRNVIVTEQDQQHDEKSMIEKFRVPFHMQNISLNPTYHTMFKYLEIDPYVTDMYGNNLLHYGCFFRYLSKYKGTSVLGLSEDIVSKLLNVPNNFGITPLMIDSLRFTYISFRHDEISFTLKYHREYPCLYLRNQLEQCHGLIWTPSRIQIMWSDSVPKSVVSQTYPNIHARDENGKHWSHYKSSIYSFREESNIEECLTCRDKDNMTPLHRLSNNFLEIHKFLVTHNVSLGFDYLACFDLLGRNRLMHIFDYNTGLAYNPNIEALKEELYPIGFEYVNKQQGDESTIRQQLVLVSIQTILRKHQNQEVLEFRLNRTEFPELQRRGGDLDEEFEEGDDFSHFIVKRSLRKNNEVVSLIGFMLNKGLHLQLTRNKSGKTAFDVLKEHVKPLTSMLPEKLLHRCKRPLISKAKHKFKITLRGNNVEVIEKGEEFVVCKKDNTVYAKLEVKKYFEPTKKTE